MAWAVSAFLSACTPFEFSPYEVPRDRKEDGLIRANIARLRASFSQEGNAFGMAVLSDIHTDYDALRAAVRHIDADTSIHLAVIAGDLTQFGLLREYRWLTDILAGLSKPYFTVPGNHDAQANGTEIYRRLFGPLDYSFVFRGVKFVFYNDNAWEFPCCVPDFDWLEAEFSDPAGADRLFAISHIPPFGDQFDSSSGRRMRDLLVAHQVRLAIHGHQHNYHLENLEGGRTLSLVAEEVGARNYAKVAVAGDSLSVERIYF